MLFDDEDWNYLHQVLNNEGLLVKYPDRHKNPLMQKDYYTDVFEMWKEVMQPKWSLNTRYADVTPAQMKGLIRRKGMTFKKYIKSRDDPNYGGKIKEEYLNQSDDSGNFGPGLALDGESLTHDDTGEDGDPHQPELREDTPPTLTVNNYTKSTSATENIESSVKEAISPHTDSLNNGLKSFVVIGDKSLDFDSIPYLKKRPKRLKVRKVGYKSRQEIELAELEIELARKKIKNEEKMQQKLDLETQIAEEKLEAVRQERQKRMEIFELLSKRICNNGDISTEDQETQDTLETIQVVTTIMS